MTEDYITLLLVTENLYPCKLVCVFTIHCMGNNKCTEFNGRVNNVFYAEQQKDVEITKLELYILVSEAVQFYNHLD